jgi:glutamate decarboxylase
MCPYRATAAAATLSSGNEVDRGYDEYDVSDRLKEQGWVLPAYTMAPNARHVKLLRAVIR